MRAMSRVSFTFALGLAFASVQFTSDSLADAKTPLSIPGNPIGLLEGPSSVDKAASATTVASRATVSSNATVYGGFELANSALVYILVRGNSLGSLGVTQGYLDAPRVRLYDSQGRDLIGDSTGKPGFNYCASSNTTTDLPVINFYQNVRGQPTHSRDSCIAVNAGAGAYTFSVTPSISSTSTLATSTPAFGEVLFEVTLGPQGAAPNTNRDRSAQLIGGTWTYTYTIISTFSDAYTFTTISSSPDSQGRYLVTGTNPGARLVGGFYDPALNLWAVLYQGFTIDYFYTFTFSDNNHVSGCYYQISPTGSTNLSRCYSMTGIRQPFFKSTELLLDETRVRREVLEDGIAGFPEPGAIEAYNSLKAGLAKGLRTSEKSASTRTVASRATATSTATVYGGFELASSATVYVLVRGNSLGSLGVTQGYLDLPRLRLYDSAGRDLAFDTSGAAGFNRCLTTGTASAVVADYYRRIRGAPVHDNDACTSRLFSPGAYTFSVTPSILGVTSPAQSVPPSGEILFEVTLGP